VCSLSSRKAAQTDAVATLQCWNPFSIDITGRHPRSNKGNEYIVTIVDLFSKYAEAIPVRNYTAPVIAKILLEQIFCRFGSPLRIISDLGREFESELFQDLCRRLEINKIHSSAYKPSTNANVERFHRTLNSMLAKVIDENQREWDKKLPAVMAAYRSAKHDSTGFSPNFLVHRRENRAPIDLVLGPIQEANDETAPKNVNEFVDERLRTYQDAYQLARCNKVPLNYVNSHITLALSRLD